jgi:recombination protein RecA
MSKQLDAFFKSFQQSEELTEFRLAHETVGEKVPSISTGSLILDDALSSGGIPKGRIVQLYGAAGSGKTLMAMLTMKEAQREDPTAQQLFIDAEQTFSTTWAETLGLDTSRIIVVEGDLAANGRRCFEMLLGVPKEDAKTHALVGKKVEGLFDKVVKGELNINMVVLDSLGAIIPPGEDVSAVGKANMALLSRFLTPTFRKLSLELSKAKIPMIIINHKRDNMDPYGADHTFSGGNTYNHSLSANIYFEAVQRKDAMILDEKEQKIGHPIRATIEKSKFGPWPRKCEFKVNFSIGVIDRHEEIAQLALDYNVVTKPSSVTHEYNGEKWVGFPKFCEAIRDNQELANELTLKISEARDARFDKKRQEQEEIKNAEDSSAEDDLANILTKKAKKVK